MSEKQATLTATLVAGYGIASGKANDPRFPDGSIAPQLEAFLSAGLDLRHCYSGTLNLDISPWRYRLVAPDYRFEQLHWCKDFHPEDFYLHRLEIKPFDTWVSAYLYVPSPETKSEHFHPQTQIEVLAPFISGLSMGQKIDIRTKDNALVWIDEEN